MAKPRFRPGCECGDCPKLPADRPPTLDECTAYYAHDGWFPEWKVRNLAIQLYVHRYASWVNTRGWRKPPGWTGGRVPLAKLLPAKRRIFCDEYRRIVARLMKEAKDA